LPDSSSDLDIIVYIRFDILRELNDRYTVNIPYICQRCGNCCKNNAFPDPQALPEVIKFLELTEKELVVKYLNKGKIGEDSNPMDLLYEKEPCVFYEENRCTIYPVRPVMCRQWFPKRYFIENQVKKGTKKKFSCFAHEKHLKLTTKILKNKKYSIGVWESIYIGTECSEENYPTVASIEDIPEKTFTNYFSPTESELIEMWRIISSFHQSIQERELFFLLNPALTNVIIE
jgi:Fe-S-cluster containining protein